MDAQAFKGKVAVVTGSGRGLGKAYALLLAQYGADIAVTDRSAASANRFGEGSAEDTVAQIRAMGCRSSFFSADLTDPAAVEGLVQEVVETFGHIDIWVNNAGGDIGAHTPRPDPDDCLDIAVEDVESVVSRNLLATIYACKFAGQQMRRQMGGKIINVGSIGAHMALPTGAVYNACKRGIEHYTRCMAEQMRPYNVNVNCLSPGYAKSARIASTRQIPDMPDTPRLERFAEPEDMAKSVAFLAGPDSDRLTGETIVFW